MVVVRGVCVRRRSDRIGFVMEPFIWGLSRYGCSGESWIFARRDEFHAWHDMDLRKGDRIGMQCTFTLDEYRFPYVDNRVNAQLLIKSGLDAHPSSMQHFGMVRHSVLQCDDPTSEHFRCAGEGVSAPVNCSGALKAGVPAICALSSGSPSVLAIPKSDRTEFPSSSRSTFPGLTSRWMIPLACRASSAESTSARMRIRFARPVWAYALRFVPMYSLVAILDMFLIPPLYS